MVLEIIKLILKYFIIIAVSFIIGAFLGHPEYGMIIIFALVAYASYSDAKMKRIDRESEESKPHKSLSTNGVLTKITEEDGSVKVYAHKRFNGTEQDILDFANVEKEK